MEQKVWNDLFAAFMKDQQSQKLIDKYRSRPGCSSLVKEPCEWEKGGFAPALRKNSQEPPFLGRRGEFAIAPVFRATPTEAHCFAEWLGGRLPKLEQWKQAAGLDEDNRPGPFEGKVNDPDGMALAKNCGTGPWPVTRGSRDLSIYKCRQMATNGREWTRTLRNATEEIPLSSKNGDFSVECMGKSYTEKFPLTFDELRGQPSAVPCDKADAEIGFRIVIEQ